MSLFDNLTEQQALEATGNAWKVHCYRDGNRRQVVRVVWIRAATREGAERAAREISGKRTVAAFAYRPWLDSAVSRFVRRIQ